MPPADGCGRSSICSRPGRSPASRVRAVRAARPSPPAGLPPSDARSTRRAGRREHARPAIETPIYPVPMRRRRPPPRRPPLPHTCRTNSCTAASRASSRGGASPRRRSGRRSRRAGRPTSCRPRTAARAGRTAGTCHAAADEPAPRPLRPKSDGLDRPGTWSPSARASSRERNSRRSRRGRCPSSADTKRPAPGPTSPVRFRPPGGRDRFRRPSSLAAARAAKQSAARESCCRAAQRL